MIEQTKDDETGDFSSALYEEQEGTRHVANILKAVENEPWGITLLQLAWTAGPLTYIALQGGYYLGYGKTAPWSLVTYFASYTLIAGVIGFAIKVFYQAYQNYKNDELKNNYLSTIDTLYYLIHKISDFRLSQLSESDRRFESAAILLGNTHALPASVELGVLELTSDKKLAELAKKIELFRQASLLSRVKDIINHSLELKRKKLQNILNIPHQAVNFLKMRLEGYAPTLQQGLERTDGFLQRIHLARQEKNLQMMSIIDAKEFLVLLYELLNDREISYLTFTYTGKKKLRQAARYLEKARSGFRGARAALITQLDQMYTILVNDNWIDDTTNRDLRERYEQVVSAMNQVSQSLSQNKRVDNRFSSVFLKLIHLYNRLYRQYRTTISWEKQLGVAIENWQTISNKYNDRATRFRYGRGHKGLRISTQTIRLDDTAKLSCSNAIVENILSFWQDVVLTQKLSAVKIKKFIIELSYKTDVLFDIGNPVVQYGIESSMATNLRSIDGDSSVAARAFWTSSMVKETANNTAHAAEKLSKVLLYEYNEELDDKAIAFLVNRYQANEKNIRKFIKEKQESGYMPINQLEIKVTKSPLMWDKALKASKQT